SAADAAEQAEATCGADAARHRALGDLWWQELGRVDRAILHHRRAWELSREPAAMDALRAVHAALGDEDALERLTEEELAEKIDDARAAALLHALGALHARRGALGEASAALERALALRPDDATKELLAEVDAVRDRGRAVELCLELAAARRAAGDGDAAVTYVRRAPGLGPAAEAARAAPRETARGPRRRAPPD